ncbi:hypothetical protein AMTRI_Chr04g190250 [Amborella trichopoda]
MGRPLVPYEETSSHESISTSSTIGKNSTQVVIIFNLPRLPKMRTRRRDDSSSHLFHPSFFSKNTLCLISKLYALSIKKRPALPATLELKEPNGAICGGEPKRKPEGELSLIASFGCIGGYLLKKKKDEETPIWKRRILMGKRCQPLNDFNDICMNIEDEAEKEEQEEEVFTDGWLSSPMSSSSSSYTRTSSSSSSRTFLSSVNVQSDSSNQPKSNKRRVSSSSVDLQKDVMQVLPWMMLMKI